ncbi:MAG: hypothetical protein IJ263_08655, partial [Paludibacteraceae bacterium]|nr:hypothetical protein [Paludibacteraceae bacterium]
MKKIFNLAVILATLMGAATFTSCEDDEEEATKKAEEQGLTELQVVKGGEYSASGAVKGFTFKVTSVEGSYLSKDQVVKLEIDGFDGELTLSDAGNSYLMWTGSQFITANTATASADAKSIVMCLACANSKLSAVQGNRSVNGQCSLCGSSHKTYRMSGFFFNTGTVYLINHI